MRLPSRSFHAPIRRSASSTTWASVARLAAASASAFAFRSDSNPAAIKTHRAIVAEPG